MARGNQLGTSPVRRHLVEWTTNIEWSAALPLLDDSNSIWPSEVIQSRSGSLTTCTQSSGLGPTGQSSLSMMCKPRRLLDGNDPLQSQNSCLARYHIRLQLRPVGLGKSCFKSVLGNPDREGYREGPYAATSTAMDSLFLQHGKEYLFWKAVEIR